MVNLGDHGDRIMPELQYTGVSHLQLRGGLFVLPASGSAMFASSISKERFMKFAHILVTGMVLGGAVGPLSAAADASEPQSRQEQVARSGASVMPFDLARTTHFFDDNNAGGVESVTANDKGDTAQIELIREHLKTEAQRFGQGDFSDPARIHGKDMPGLAGLAAAGNKLRVSYQQLPAGASLTYASDDQTVVNAVHAWFAAQRSDHGAHEHMHMHK